jgi:hypothetical protein
MRPTLALLLVLATVSCIGPTAVLDQTTSSLGPFTDPRAIAGEGADRAPPAIVGGTLGVDGDLVVVADPDRDRAMLVRISTRHVTEIALPSGSEPTRVAIAPARSAFVVLRGTGEVATIALTGSTSVTRRWVCDAPRGIAYDPRTTLVRVACQGGELVSFDPSVEGAISTLALPFDDLRDVIVVGGAIVLSRFRSAELVRIDPEGNVIVRAQPPSMPNDSGAGGTTAGRFVPSVAWRTTLGETAIVMTHQVALDAVIEVDARVASSSIERNAPPSSPYGGQASPVRCGNAVVQSFVTHFDPNTLAVLSSLQIPVGALPVDVTGWLNGEGVVVAMAGVQQLSDRGTAVQSFALMDATGTCLTAMPGVQGAFGITSPIAVALAPDGRVIVQRRDPALLAIDGVMIPLGGESVFDTGHALFHVDAGQGVACASCHPEGGDDGNVWHFSDTGARRTLSLPHGLSSTAPFHWNGELRDLHALMPLVFTARMGGAALDPARVDQVGRWLDTRPTGLRTPGAIDDASTRGRVLFEGRAGCASCHAGAMLTNATTVDVGTGGAFQVPTLAGVSRRLPLMHDGCALTLEQRFTDASCGGSAHGAQDLTTLEIADLIAYLRTL